MPQRYPTVIRFALLGVLVAIVVVVALLFLGPPVSQVGYYHPPISGDPGCEPNVPEIGSNPPPPGACIQTVIPGRTADSAVVVVDVWPDLPRCVEGCPTWLQVRSAAEGVVVQQRMDASPTRAYLPEGSFVVSVYTWSPCQGDCETGVSTMFACSYEITVAPRETISLDFPWRDGRSCPTSSEPTL